jgi:hypothetical protein
MVVTPAVGRGVMTRVYKRAITSLRCFRETGRLLAVAVFIGCSVAQAMTPLTPHLTTESRERLLTRLDEVGFPDVGKNSVLLALAEALGGQVRNNVYLYELPYAHLPRIEARSTPALELPGCTEVILTASYAPPNNPTRLRVEGVYCLVGPGKWTARTLTIDTN